jgi:hypothetical protein
MEEFQGLYTSTSRVGVKDEQCWWIDGLMPFGRMMLRTLYGTGGAVWTAPGHDRVLRLCQHRQQPRSRLRFSLTAAFIRW